MSVRRLWITTEWVIKLRRVLELFNRSLEACKVVERNEALFSIVEVFGEQRMKQQVAASNHIDQLLSAFLRSVIYLRRHDSGKIQSP